MTNKAECCGDYYILYTTKGEPFYIDSDDYDRVKNYLWNRTPDGYITANIGRGKTMSLHRFIMGFPKNKLVDHIGGETSRNDCRKSNLRIATKSQNSINKKMQSNNSSGCVGVSFDNSKQKWRAEIWLKGKRIHLGWFKNYDDAVRKRQEAEEEYFGEWSYKNSQKHWFETSSNRLNIQESA